MADSSLDPLLSGFTAATNGEATSQVNHSLDNRDPSAKSFYYPEGLGRAPFDKWIFFEARSGRHVVRDQVISEAGGKDRTLSSVGLYLSESALKNSLNVIYETNHMGPFMGAIVEMFAQSGRNLMDIIGTVGNDWVGKLKQALTDPHGQSAGDTGTTLLQQAGATASGLGDVLKRTAGLSNQAFGQMIGADVIKGVDELTGGGGSVLFGKRPNPRTDVLFDTQNYRESEFSFLMIPRNIREAQMIDNIVRFFQFYMLPKYDTIDPQLKIGSFMLGFPYEFEISIRDGNAQELQHVNKFERSVLTNVFVDHAAGGKTAFVKDDNGAFWPVATQLTLSFKEVRLLDRNSPAIQRTGTQTLPDPRT